jgi:hypothetical protein
MTINSQPQEFSTGFYKLALAILPPSLAPSQSCRNAIATMLPRFRQAEHKPVSGHIGAALTLTMVVWAL